MAAPGLTGDAGCDLDPASASAKVSRLRRGVAAICVVTEFSSLAMLAGSTGVKASAWPGLPVEATKPSLVATMSPGRSVGSLDRSNGASPRALRPLQVQL